MNTGVLIPPCGVVILPSLAAVPLSFLSRENLNTFHQMRNGECGIKHNTGKSTLIFMPYSEFRIRYILSGAFTPSILSALEITVFTCFIRNSFAPVRPPSSVITRCLK